MAELAGRVAIVTGAAQGIGEAVARKLAKAVVKVAVLDCNEARSREVVESLSKEAEAIALTTDMKRPDEIQAAVERTKTSWRTAV
jgi:NAD(P)-dependent dehydrogenase (short-subunit alcohol dehydrogenase family)